MNTAAAAWQASDRLFLRRIRATLGTALEGWQRRRLQRATYAALSGLDAHILRDIGIDPSEIPSIAHAAGAGDATRIRFMQPVRHRADY